MAFFLKKKLLGIATIANLWGTGFIADYIRHIIAVNGLTPSTLYGKILMAGSALLLLCFASAAYMSADMGVSGYDAIAIIVASKVERPFRICRIFSDVLCVCIGSALGGKIGIYTVLTAGFMGPFIQFFREKVVDTWIWSNK